MDPLNYREAITQEGLDFAHSLCDGGGDRGEVEEYLEMYDVTEFVGRSGSRFVCEFRDEFATDKGWYFDDQHHNTFLVLKACNRPNPQNYKEIEIWKRAKDDGCEGLFAPVHAWDGAYRWVLMKRVTLISPVEGDIAYLPRVS